MRSFLPLIVVVTFLAGMGISTPFAQSRSSAAPATATRRVTDIAGRVVVIPSTVRRVADPWHANNGMVLMLGGADKLVATSLQARRQPWFRKLYPRINEIPAPFDDAGGVNMESLLSARPDVVLMSYGGGTLPKWMDAADAYHIPVVMMPNTSLADLKTTVRMTGEVLGEQELRTADAFVQYFDDNIRRVTGVTSKIPRSQRVRVLHTATASIFAIDGQKTLIDDWINVAGGINAAEVIGNASPVTMEQIAVWNPDVIIVGTAPNIQSRQAILDDPRWRQIKAVKEGRVYVNPTGVYLWDRHSAEAALQILWAAKLLYPDRFSDLDVRKETKLFYSRFFHHALTDAEFESIMKATAP